MLNILKVLFTRIYSALSKTPLRKVPGILFISNYFFRGLWGYQNTILLKDGTKLYVEMNHPRHALRYTFQAYALNLVHEEETSKLFRSICEPGMTVLDIGANIGYFSLIASKIVGKNGKVYSFEPEVVNFEFLSKNIQINNCENVIPNNLAVSDVNGTIDLFICEYDSGHHTINQSKGIESYARGRKFNTLKTSIKSVRIDDFLKENNIHKVDIIKMDIEGAEFLAVSGMSQTLLNGDIKILMEYFPLLIDKMGSNKVELINNFMNKYKYNIYVIPHDYDSQKRGGLVKVKNIEQLNSLIINSDDHINLFLSKQ